MYFRANIIFGLNALNGRVSLPDGSMGGPWDSSNAAALIRYTVEKGYTIHGWELGERDFRLHSLTFDAMLGLIVADSLQIFSPILIIVENFSRLCCGNFWICAIPCLHHRIIFYATLSAPKIRRS